MVVPNESVEVPTSIRDSAHPPRPGRAGADAPHVSVVIPVLDDARLLDRCLAALATQTREPFEIIVVDNGSRDDSAAVARRWNVRLMEQLEPGIPATSSAGYDAATSEVIARLDADSVPPPDWIERITAAFAGDATLDAVTGPGDFPELGPVGRRLAGVGYMQAYFVFAGVLVGSTPLFGSNFAMRRTTWREVRHLVNRFDAEVHDDFDLSLNLGPRRHVRLDPTMRVDISSRPFRDARSLARRFARGLHTIRANGGILAIRLGYSRRTLGRRAVSARPYPEAD